MDITKNTALVSFSCSYNQLINIDVTKNTALTSLYCNENKINTLDVNNNIALESLNCFYNQISSLDLTKNTALTFIECQGNHLTTLDLSRNTALKHLHLTNNQLISLDIGNIATLLDIDCSNNHLTYSSLPINQPSWTQYSYSPQNPIQIAKSLNKGIELDLSSQFFIGGNTSVYIWKTKSGSTLEQGTDYTFSEGKTTFLKAQSDSVFCEMTNTSFPDLTGSNALKTTYTKVTGSTSTENVKKPEVLVYTQSNTLFITVPYIAQLTIFDIHGKMIVSKSMNIGKSSISMQISGIYLVKLSGNNDMVTRKVLIE